MPEKLAEVFALHVWANQASQTLAQSALATLWALVWVSHPETLAVSRQELPSAGRDSRARADQRSQRGSGASSARSSSAD